LLDSGIERAHLTLLAPTLEGGSGALPITGSNQSDAVTQGSQQMVRLQLHPGGTSRLGRRGRSHPAQLN
jgi:hypothetical protein